jgi:PadR family transcriptional regulator, regulatory protein PadR
LSDIIRTIYDIEIRKGVKKEMTEQVLRKLFLGFIQLHILYHAKKEPFYGSWMLRELAEHGYTLSPGTLYPILHQLETEGLLERHSVNSGGKIRKYYSITVHGSRVLAEAREKALELVREIDE